MINLSIITPFYNSEKILKNHFKKIIPLAKNYPFEIIYINDASKDKGETLIKKLIKNSKLNNIKVFSLKKNLGPGTARNLGLSKCKGEYILFLDADDYLLKKSIFKLNQKLNKKLNKKIDIFFLGFDKKNNKQINLSSKSFSKKTIIKKYIKTDLDMNTNFYLFRREFLTKNKIYFKKGFYEDIIFMLKAFCFMNKSQKFKFKTYFKNNTKNSITNTTTLKHLKDFMNTSKEKKNFYFKNKKKLFSGISSKDLQYGLRGDYCFAIKISKRIFLTKYQNKINLFYKRLINREFKTLTEYDKIVKINLFKQQI